MPKPKVNPGVAALRDLASEPSPSKKPAPAAPAPSGSGGFYNTFFGSSSRNDANFPEGPEARELGQISAVKRTGSRKSPPKTGR